MDFIWKDRKRYFGLPISFTKYKLSINRIFFETGLFNLKEEEVLLYRVRDISVKRSFWQRLFGVGTVCIVSSDKTAPHLDLKNIKNPMQVKEMIFEAVEKAKDARRMRATEILDDGHLGDIQDGDFDSDDFDR